MHGDGQPLKDYGPAKRAQCRGVEGTDYVSIDAGTLPWRRRRNRSRQHRCGECIYVLHVRVSRFCNDDGPKRSWRGQRPVGGSWACDRGDASAGRQSSVACRDVAKVVKGGTGGQARDDVARQLNPLHLRLQSIRAAAVGAQKSAQHFLDLVGTARENNIKVY